MTARFSLSLRRTTSSVALVILCGLLLSSRAGPAGGTSGRLALALSLLMVPLLLLTFGLLIGAWWSRWLGLAVGVAVLPWAVALTLVPGDVARWRALLAMVASLGLLGSLAGKEMRGRYEARVGGIDWEDPRMTLLRMAMVCGAAAALSLYGFGVAYQARIGWHQLIPAALLLLLAPGLLLLARGKTAGLLLVGISCVGLIPAGAWFVGKEATSPGEGALFAALMLPAAITGSAALFAFAGPMLRYLRSA